MKEIVLLRNGIWDFLREISDDMDRVFRPLIEMHGLTMIQMRVLMEIHQCEIHTIGSLAKAISLSNGNASAMCKRLEKEGLIERIRDTQDERVVKLGITKRGSLIVEDLEDTLQQKYGELMYERDPKDLEDIYMGIKKLSELFKDMISIQ